MFRRAGAFVTRRPRLVLAAAPAFLAPSVLFGAAAAGLLKTQGYDDPRSGSRRAALVDAELRDLSESDLERAEALVLPGTPILLVLVFGSVVAAALPLLIGVLAIAGTLLVLSVLGRVTDVSAFALNLTAVLGLGLGIDYGLLIASRFREELAAGLLPGTAAVRTAPARPARLHPRPPQHDHAGPAVLHRPRALGGLRGVRAGPDQGGARRRAGQRPLDRLRHGPHGRHRHHRRRPARLHPPELGHLAGDRCGPRRPPRRRARPGRPRTGAHAPGGRPEPVGTASPAAGGAEPRVPSSPGPCPEVSRGPARPAQPGPARH